MSSGSSPRATRSRRSRRARKSLVPPCAQSCARSATIRADIETLAARTRLPIPTVVAALTELEIDGRVAAASRRNLAAHRLSPSRRELARRLARGARARVRAWARARALGRRAQHSSCRARFTFGTICGSSRRPLMSKSLIIAEKPSVAADICARARRFHAPRRLFRKRRLRAVVGGRPSDRDRHARRGGGEARQMDVRAPSGDPVAVRAEADREEREPPEDAAAAHQAQGRRRPDQCLRRRPRRRAHLPLHRAVRQSREADPPAVAAIDDDRRDPRGLRDRCAPISQMRPLADAAVCRSEADWLVGINGTRAMTAFNSKSGGFQLTTVGRVQTPTLAILVEREEKIRAFRPRELLGGAWHVSRPRRRVRRALVRREVGEEGRRPRCPRRAAVGGRRRRPRSPRSAPASPESSPRRRSRRRRVRRSCTTSRRCSAKPTDASDFRRARRSRSRNRSTKSTRCSRTRGRTRARCPRTISPPSRRRWRS